MYDTIRGDFYRPYMVIDVYAKVRSCQSCAKGHHTNNRRRKLRLLPTSELLEAVVNDVFGLLPKTNSYKGDIDGLEKRHYFGNDHPRR